MDGLKEAALELANKIDKFVEGEPIYSPFHPIAVELNRKRWNETKY